MSSPVCAPDSSSAPSGFEIALQRSAVDEACAAETVVKAFPTLNPSMTNAPSAPGDAEMEACHWMGGASAVPPKDVAVR